MAVQDPALEQSLAHASTLFELARLDASDLPAALRSITERAAAALGVQRVGVWLFDESRSTISCVDLYRRDLNRHEQGIRLQQSDAPTYFREAAQSRTLAAHDARADPRTRELSASYLVPHGITSMLDVPIWRHGEVVGIVCQEHVGPPRVWSPEEQRFASNVADIVSRAMESDDRMRAEVERADLLAQLALERDRFDEVLRQMPAGVILIDADGRLLLQNGEAERLLHARLAPGTLISESYPTAIDEAGERYPWLRLPVARSLERREVVVEEEMRIVRDDGSIIDVSVNAAPVFDREGELIAAVTAFLDVTERKRIEAELAEEARFREHFVAILGHDLRTPLMAVRMAARMLERMVGHDTMEAQILARMTTSTRRMSRMIDDLLDFTRIRQHGGVPLHPSEADLQVICTTVIEELREVWPGRTLVFDVSPGAYTGIWDPDRLAQALSNLIGNAMQHGAEDTPVTVRLEERGETVIAAIINCGAPIPEAVAADIFKPFRAVDSGGGGLGLGLFISHSVVAGHGGSLSFRTGPEGETIFTVELPRRCRRSEAGSPLGPVPG